MVDPSPGPVGPIHTLPTPYHRPPPAQLRCLAHPAPPWGAVQQIRPLQEVLHYHRGQGPGIPLAEWKPLRPRDFCAPRDPLCQG
eukprot:1176127-Prorocentrum_minimum.AAC.1